MGAIGRVPPFQTNGQFDRAPKWVAKNAVQVLSEDQANTYLRRRDGRLIAIDKASKFVYASNRGPGTIAVFAVNGGDGKLKQIQVAETGGTFPRAFEFDPTGRFLLVGDQKANSFVIFSIDRASGKLTLTGEKFDIPSPVCFLFVPAE